MVISKCIYCNKELELNSTAYTDNDDNQYCSGICQTKGTNYNAFQKKFVVLFLIIIFLGLIGAVSAATFAQNRIIASISVLVIGIAAIIFPFGSSVEQLGIKKTKIIVGSIGALLAVVGITMIFTYY